MSTDQTPPPVKPVPRGQSFHARAAATGWGARLQRRYLGLSLATHVVLIGVSGAVAAVVIGADESQARGPVAVRMLLPEEAPVEAAEDVAARPSEELSFPDPEDLAPDDPEPAEELPGEDLDPVLLPDVLPLDARFPPLAEPAPEPQPVPDEVTAPVEAPDPAPEVTEADPVLVLAPPPDYPRRARRAGLEGSVDCLLVVEADGRVSSVRVVRSSGHAILDAAAVEALHRWVFQPGLSAGLPGRREVEHRVTFQLDG